ncbi:MAG: ribosome maturation factor RimM [Proteobacteria bacterium]|nr:MAG: ribosome maturation factor RimM [Pseudomonadota bacterium]
MNGNRDSLVELGSINGVFGIRGWVKVFSHTSPRIKITDYRTWVVEHNGVSTEYRVLGGRNQGKAIVAQLEGIDDRNQSESLVGATIYVHKSQLETLAEGEYYWSELVGLRVVNLDGQDLGVVDWLFETGNNDVMVVKGDRERFIPYIKGDCVKSIDLDASEVVVDWDPDF